MAEEVLTSYTNTDDVAYITFGNNFYNTISPHAQGFKISSSDYNITSVEVKIIQIPASTLNWTVSIQTDNSGKPSGNLIDANATKTISGPLSVGISKITFDNPFPYSINTQYWLVLEQLEPTFGINWGMSLNYSGGYTDGTFLYSTDAGANWTDSGSDYYFVINGETTGTSKILKVAGISQANVKTVYPTALANISKVAGVSNS